MVHLPPDYSVEHGVPQRGVVLCGLKYAGQSSGSLDQAL